MKYLLIIISVILISFLPETDICKHEFPGFTLQAKFSKAKTDTIFQSDGSVYGVFSVKYLKPFECWHCQKDSVFSEPKPEVWLLKPAYNIQFSYLKF